VIAKCSEQGSMNGVITLMFICRDNKRSSASLISVILLEKRGVARREEGNFL